MKLLTHGSARTSLLCKGCLALHLLKEKARKCVGRGNWAHARGSEGATSQRVLRKGVCRSCPGLWTLKKPPFVLRAKGKPF